MEGSISLEWELSTSLSSYYEYNIKTCADKGMRLPTIYETNTTYAWAPILADGDGIKASLAVGKGVPFVPGYGYWTASARKSNSNDWWVTTNGGVAYGSPAGGAASVRCVLPNSY